jgi:predicted DNA-binding WGR domain protein
MTSPEQGRDAGSSEVYLRRVNADRNMARFYTLTVEMALFETWSCTRTYGRIGARHGRVMVGLYPSEEEALDAFRRILRQKGKRGYRPAVEAPPAVPAPT